jgi:predicted ATPase
VRSSSLNNLPAEASSFVGRDALVATVCGRFDEGARLITLLGPGGFGKTRLAQRIARERLSNYTLHGGGGAWFVTCQRALGAPATALGLCDLTSTTSALGLLHGIAAATGVTLSDRTIDEQVLALGRALARRKLTLLVLDDVEPIVEVAAPIVRALLGAAPRLRVLATSRVRLGLVEEWVEVVPPLGLPPDGEQDPESLRASEAVALFLERARQVRPEVALAPRELAAVVEIVRRVEGIPLAIELAAARTAALSAIDLARRLDGPAAALVRRGDAGRHGSMRAVIESSIGLLSSREARALEALSVFRGGFDLEAAESVLATDGDALGEDGALPVLEALAWRALLRCSTGPDGEARYALYETIREVAVERLEERGARANVLERHAAHFARHVPAWAERGPSLGEQRARIEQDLENALLAHATLLARRDAEARDAALDLGRALSPTLAARGSSRLQLDLWNATLPVAGPREAEARIARAQAHRDLGALGAAREDLERARALAPAGSAEQALASVRLAELVEVLGHTDEAKALLSATLASLTEEAVPIRAEAHRRLAHALRREGALAQASVEAARAIDLQRRIGPPEELGLALYEAAVLALFSARFTEALACFEEALQVARTASARLTEGATLAGLGVWLQEVGRPSEALARHAEAVAIFRSIGNRHREASALYTLGATYLELGRPEDAEPTLLQSLELFEPIGAPRYCALVEAALAVARASRGLSPLAESHLLRADEFVARCGSESAVGAAVAIHRATVRMIGMPGTAAELSLEVEARARAAPNDDTRFARRVFAAKTAPAAPRADALRVSADGGAVWLPGAPRPVELGTRVALRRIVRALADRRAAAPGEGLDRREILEAGWPGERVREDSGANRVHVALTTLRKLGLRHVLVSVPGGYAFDPAVPLEPPPA